MTKRAILILAAPLFASACISTRGDTYPEETLRATTRQLTWLSPTLPDNLSESSFDAIINSPKEAFAHFCSSGKPKHAWNLPVRAVRPRLPAGIPIDQASAINGEVYQFFKQSISANLFLNELILASEDSGSTSAASKTNSTILTLNSPEPEHLIKTLQNTRLVDNLTTVLVGFNKRQELTLGMIRTRKFAHKNAGMENGKKRLRVHEVLDDSSKGGAIAGVIWESQKLKDTDGNYVWPIHPAGILEAGLLPTHFTMLIPENVQKKFFDKKQSGRGFFIRPDGAFDLTEAIKDRRKLWNAYFSQAVRVDEAQTEDPSIIQFNIRLNLDLFCAYARPVKDLLTK